MMPCFNSSWYNFSLVTWMVVPLTAVKFEPLPNPILQAFAFSWSASCLHSCLYDHIYTEFGKPHAYHELQCTLENCQRCREPFCKSCRFSRWVFAADSQVGQDNVVLNALVLIFVQTQWINLILGWCFLLRLYFNENDSDTFVRNLSCLYCTQTTLHVLAIQPSSGVSYI
jgi:hypothetical protein